MPSFLFMPYLAAYPSRAHNCPPPRVCTELLVRLEVLGRTLHDPHRGPVAELVPWVLLQRDAAVNWVLLLFLL